MEQVFISKIAVGETELGINNNFTAWTGGIPDNYTWNNGLGEGLISHVTTDPSYSHVASIQKSSLGNDVYLQSVISDMTAGAQYRLTFYCKNASRSRNSYFYFELLGTDSLGGAIEPLIRTKQVIITNSRWKKIEINWNQPAGASKLEMKWYAPEIVNVDVEISSWSVKKLTEYDISGYIKDIGDSGVVNYEENNPDLSPIVTAFQCNISYNPNVEPENGDYFYIKINGYVKFSGSLVAVKPVDKTGCYECQVEKDFGLLQRIQIRFDTLSNYLTNTTDAELWKYPDATVNGYDCGNFQVLWVLYNMFMAAGLNLDVDLVKDIRIGEYDDADDHNTYELLARHFGVDQSMIYNINQNNACNPLNVISNFSDNMISLWDYIAITCSHLGYYIKCLDKRSYRLKHISERVFDEISDDLKFDYEPNSIDRKYEEMSIEWNWNIDRSKYYDNNLNDLDTERNAAVSRADNRASRKSKTHAASKQNNSAKWYNNLQYQLRDLADGTTGKVKYNSLGVDIETRVALDYDRLLIDCHDYREEDITTDSEVDGDCVGIDLNTGNYVIKRYIYE